MTFKTGDIYRRYTDAYHRCIGIDMSIAELAETHPNFEGVDAEYAQLCKDGDHAYFELLELYHRLCMCIALDVAVIRGQLRDDGVFAPEPNDEKTIQKELEL